MRASPLWVGVSLLVAAAVGLSSCGTGSSGASDDGGDPSCTNPGYGIDKFVVGSQTYQEGFGGQTAYGSGSCRPGIYAWGYQVGININVEDLPTPEPLQPRMYILDAVDHQPGTYGVPSAAGFWVYAADQFSNYCYATAGVLVISQISVKSGGTVRGTFNVGSFVCAGSMSNPGNVSGSYVATLE